MKLVSTYKSSLKTYHLAKAPTTHSVTTSLQGIKPIKVSKPITRVHLRSNMAEEQKIGKSKSSLRFVHAWSVDPKVYHQKNRYGGTVIRKEPKQGRNDLCNCNSGKKYKKCCISK